MVVLLVGLSASGGGASIRYRSVRQSDRTVFASQAESVTASVSSAVRRDVDFVAGQQGLVLSLPRLTNRELAAWYSSIDLSHRFPGSIGFGYIERVRPAALAAFEAAVTADPPINNPVRGVYTVAPTTDQHEYCLERFGITLTAQKSLAIPPTFDFCGPDSATWDAAQLPAILAEAEISGRVTVLPARVGTGGDEIFVVFDPTYADGVRPATATARDAALTGWMIGTFSGTRLLGAALGGPSGGTLEVSVLAGAPGGTTTLAATSGRRPRGAVETRTQWFTADGGRWAVRVTGPSPSRAWAQGLIVGGLGATVSLLLALSILLLGWARSRALRLVDERSAELRHLALHDPLTGLPNRALIRDRADQMLRRARRSPRQVGAMFIDIDDFKAVNDRFGHPAGDAVLLAVARRLQAALRPGDTVGRFGGDEFVVLTEGPPGDNGAVVVAQRLRADLSVPCHLDGVDPGGGSGVELTVGVSIGIAVGVRPDAEHLLRDADIALYEAKAAGKKRTVLFDPEMGEAVQRRMALELELNRVVESGQLFLVYQPTFDIGSGVANGVEALVRWRHPTLGVLVPAEFVPLAEATGAIVAIGRWVLDRACAQAARWRLDGLRIPMSVNVSGRQLDEDSIVEDVAGALTRHGLDPRDLTLEITESVVTRDTEAAARRLERIRSHGVRIAIDDFGTGYASVAYLRRFPVDALKIDRSFVDSVDRSAEGEALVHTLVQLGRAMGLETLAEGVEDAGQLQRLRDEHCDRGQGFLFSAPVDAAAVAGFFAPAPRVRGPVSSGGRRRPREHPCTMAP